jgi:predicted nucleic acid-binding protein
LIVADSSPLIALSSIRRLDLLESLYGRVIVPDAVYDEVAHGGTRPAGQEILRAGWIERRAVRDRDLVELLRRQLGAGESEAIALARECAAELLLVDDKRARAAAANLGVPITGVVGLIAEAKIRAIVPSARDLIDRLSIATPFRMSRALRERVLRELGEQ